MESNNKILVVDDDRFVRLGLKELLTEKGYVVDTAEDGFEALELVDGGEYDVILIDLILPGMSGVDTLSRIIMKKPRAKIIAMTAYSEEKSVGRAMAEGAKRCFVKPMDINSLETAMREVVAVG
jgi:CheY-like chemotaxis protein